AIPDVSAPPAAAVAPDGAAGNGGAGAGVAPVLARVRAAGGTVVATGGCFDLLHAGHVATLRAARALGQCLVVCLNSDASVRRLKGPERPLQRQEDRARVLEALECVDAVVVFDEDTPEALLDALRPDVWAKGGDYAGVELPESRLLQSWGGQAVVLPYLDGRSTTSLVAAARSTVRKESS
ncbi:MAG: D-glycero-beta-D-manno-heptose 1-phosphate adenylyltransferase, partial [Actinomycetota bacterium]|nr:D-glycero-beta-D-manno-heptose 1-phosphate adenylyltransferase [Actinomycetota bacterium]